MPKKTPLQTVQSTIGLFRVLGADPKALPRTRPLYRRLVELVEGGIARGDVPAGYRLPPERDLAKALRVSRATVVSAYRELESRGLVRGYVGRGTFVSAKPDAGSAPFAWRGKIAASALQANDTAIRDLVRAAADPSLMSLAAGEPALDCFPVDAFHRAMNDVLAKDAATAWRHGSTEGLPRFRAALAERFGGEAEHILVIAGAQQGLDLLTRCLVDRGDAVILDRPGYLGAIQTFRNAGARLVGWDIARADIDELEELLLRYRPKLIYTNPTHHNPTGVTLPIRARRELLELAARYRVPIVEDDTYRELALESAPPPSLFKLDEARNVVIRINSFSKMLAPGLRLGWISAVKPIVEQLALIKQQIDPHTQNLSQLVVCELVTRGVFDRHLVTLKAEHRRRRDAMVQALRQHVPAGMLRFAVPDGGMYLWCQLPSRIRARAVQEHAARESVILVSGEPFYVDQGGAHQLRICYTSQPPERAPRAAQIVGRAIAAAGRETDEAPIARLV
ncbi:MAG TPA: PLP-dependent aminotransferase family protein [Vicinamibacterales bacterium]|jgi:DNA-binding transcriptional MocR family regulator|nr:PLP-dependent aminotransferase family protein [Vicinamibacterales bacterium]